MHVILGGTGHVGSAVADALLERGEPVTIVARDPSRAEEHRWRGARVAAIDVLDTGALAKLLRGAARAFLLNPPADPATDTVATERRTAASIVAALDGARLEKVVAASTYGARPGEGIGDFGVLHEMERSLAAGPVPADAVRAAYYFSNWDGALASARDEGVVRSFFPTDFALPMVAPRDVGRFAARLLTEPSEGFRLHRVEGRRSYSPADVAAAFAAALGRDVEAIEIPRERWVPSMTAAGFSPAAAASFAAMTALVLEGGPAEPDEPVRGDASLRDHVEALVRADR